MAAVPTRARAARLSRIGEVRSLISGFDNDNLRAPCTLLSPRNFQNPYPLTDTITRNRLLSALDEEHWFRTSPLLVFLLHDGFLSLIYSTFSPFSGRLKTFSIPQLLCKSLLYRTYKLRPLLDNNWGEQLSLPCKSMQADRTLRTYTYNYTTFLLSYCISTLLFSSQVVSLFPNHNLQFHQSKWLLQQQLMLKPSPILKLLSCLIH
jgi:hypothetical protein